MTTSMASSVVIALGGFTGLISMWLVLAFGLRSDRKSRQSRSAPSGRRAPQIQPRTGLDRLDPPPAGAGPTIGAQRGVDRASVR
jgi:hypothetical protein